MPVKAHRFRSILLDEFATMKPKGCRIAILCISKDIQKTVDLLVDNGITGIVSFASEHFTVPEACMSSTIDVVSSIQELVFEAKCHAEILNRQRCKKGKNMLSDMTVRELYELTIDGSDMEKDQVEYVSLQGWIRTNRSGKNVGFIALNDGTYFKNAQIVYTDTLP